MGRSTLADMPGHPTRRWRPNSLGLSPASKKQPHDFRRRGKVRARAGGLEFARHWYDSDSHTRPAKSNRMVAVLRRRGAATAAPMALRAQRTQAGAVDVVVRLEPKKEAHPGASARGGRRCAPIGDGAKGRSMIADWPLSQATSRMNGR